MVNRKERMAEEFEVGAEGEAVEEYEAITDNFLHVTAALIADEVTQLMGVRAGIAVDLGAGPGGLVREMAMRFPHFLVIGLDISLPMVQRGFQRARAVGLENVAFVVADVHQLPFKPKSLGVIVSHGSIHHWRRLDLALAEIKQTLIEKGFIYMSDLRRDAPGPAVELVVSLLNEKQARAFLNSVRAAYTIEELSALVQQAGLSHVRVEPEKFCRKTTLRNLRELRKSPMRGISQATLNLRLVTKGP